MAKKHTNPRGVRLKKMVLQEARQRKGLSQAALAEMSGVSGNLTWRAENGGAIDPKNAAQIASVLGMELTDMIERRSA